MTPQYHSSVSFDLEDQRGEYVIRLGNLALLERPLNASIQNDSFDGKLPAYERSRILLTRAIAGSAEFGPNTSLKRAVAGFKPSVEWKSQQIEERQASLGQLARVVWGIEAT